jgi:hypothetical protein
MQEDSSPICIGVSDIEVNNVYYSHIINNLHGNTFLLLSYNM